MPLARQHIVRERVYPRDAGEALFDGVGHVIALIIEYRGEMGSSETVMDALRGYAARRMAAFPAGEVAILRPV